MNTCLLDAVALYGLMKEYVPKQIQFASAHVLERSAHGAPGLTNDVCKFLGFEQVELVA